MSHCVCVLLLHHDEVPGIVLLINYLLLYRDIDRGRRYSATSSGYSTTGCTDSPSSLSVSVGSLCIL